MKTFWITFYSYKGGVGRSLSLANTAALLVQGGSRVVLIDFDLEAPGLDSFQEFKSIAGKAGVVEYVTEFENTEKAPDIKHFVHSCQLPGNLRGKLWIMPAGKKDAAYNSNRTRLDWIQLYDSGIGEPFIENLKAAIARQCQPDYVLVDSRTGLTDIGGICTLHIPDLVVMLFGLNEQNVRGVAAVAKTIRESEFRRVPQLHYVASPVPNLPRDTESALAKRWHTATELLGVKIESIIRYQAIAALSEKLFVLDDQMARTPLIEDYNNLLVKLIDYNRNGIDFLLNQAREAIRAVDTNRMDRLLNIFQEEFSERAESLMIQAELKLALGHSNAAKELANQALQIDPLFQEPFDWLVSQYTKENKPLETITLCDYVLQFSDKHSTNYLTTVHRRRGDNAMAMGDFTRAAESYSFCYDNVLEGDKNPTLLLVYGFNLVEATRRRDGKPYAEGWEKIIKIFENAGEAASSPPMIQANYWQAMHIPFAITGDLARARQALTKASHAAELVGLAEDIFTVKKYTNVHKDEWLQINNEMLVAIDRGQLWDGMSLPVPQPKATLPPSQSVRD